MAAIAQVAPRKPFRLSRYKADEPAMVVPQPTSKSTHPALRLDGGSTESQPFDPSELSRRLELYQRELKLARAKREIAELNERHRKAQEALSLQDRNDSGHDSEGKTETASIEEPAESEEETAEDAAAATEENENQAEPVRLPELQKPASIRRPRPRSRPSSARARRNPAGTYFPRFAAKQFAATTTPLATKAPANKPSSSSSKQQDSIDATDVPKPKQTFADIDPDVLQKPKPIFADGFTPKQAFATGPGVPRAVERVGAGVPDLDTTRDRRRSAMLFSDLGSPSSARTAHNATTRPRPLSTALENLKFLDDDNDVDRNPYLPSAQQTQGTTEVERQGVAKDQSARPVLRYHDHQHDWSQASQCGNSARSSLHLHSIWRRESVGKKGDAKQRGKSQGDVSDSNQTMVAHAVKLVKEDRKRSSLLGFFKRHH